MKIYVWFRRIGSGISGYDQLKALFPEEGGRCANCIGDGHCSCGKDK